VTILRILWWIVHGLLLVLMWVIAIAAYLLLVTGIAMLFGGAGLPP
jgi:hypothetical protein